VPLVLDLRIDHDRVGSSTDPTLNGQLQYPNNSDQSLNDTDTKKYGNIVLTTTTGHRVWYRLCLVLIVHQAGYMVNLSDFYSYRLIGKLTTHRVLTVVQGKSWPGSH
jgi:hypothetical protein